MLRSIGIKNVEAIGCPTFYENGLNNVINVQSKIFLNDVVFTNPYKLNVFGNQPIILQAESNFIKGILEEPIRFYADGFYRSLFDAFVNKQYKIFSSIQQWKNFLSNYKFAVGSRVHGAIIAINSGCPACVLNSDLRAKEMCDLLGIPNLYKYKNLGPLELFEKIDYSQYNKNYKNLFSKYISFLHKDGLMPYSGLTCNYPEQPIINTYHKDFDSFVSNYKRVLDGLEIILITFNRCNYLNNTLKNILALSSPIKECSITILDNASTDGTQQVVNEYKEKFPNLRYIRNKVNIGGNANIVEAMKLASKKYVWFLCDDDNYNWKYWGEVVDALIADFDAILVERNWKTSDIPRCVLPNEMGFLPSTIYKTELITSDVIQNAYLNIYNSFPHLALVCYIFNNNKKIKVIEHPICIQGWALKADKEYVRGFSSYCHPKQKHTNLFLSYVASYVMLKDRSFRFACCDNLYLGKSFGYSLLVFFRQNKGYLSNLVDFFMNISIKQRIIFLFVYCYYILSKPWFYVYTKISKHNIIEEIFSIKNSKDKKFKVITIGGFKLRFKRLFKK